MNAPVSHAREVNPEEWELWIRHRVDQIPHQVAPLGLEFIVFASEGYDTGWRLLAGQFCHAVTVQAGTVDNPAGREFTLGRLQNALAAIRPQTSTLVLSQRLPPRARINSANFRQTAAKSTIPVDGTRIPARQFT
jgi:hypothetical protein